MEVMYLYFACALPITEKIRLSHSLRIHLGLGISNQIHCAVHLFQLYAI